MRSSTKFKSLTSMLSRAYGANSRAYSRGIESYAGHKRFLNTGGSIMYDNGVPQTALSRRAVVAGATLGPLLVLGGALANAADTKALNERFEYLSKNGNSNCTPEFLNSISTMPPQARLQGSC